MRPLNAGDHRAIWTTARILTRLYRRTIEARGRAAAGVSRNGSESPAAGAG
jgi:hypothetical protein